MQTFVPFQTFEQSAGCLDLKRLGKQIIEAQQIYKALTIPEYEWKNHPATKMWRGHERGLVLYANICNLEWIARRGKSHGAYDNLVKMLPDDGAPGRSAKPDWWGSRVHITHQSNLLRKDPEHYRQFFPGVPDDLEYYWPEV